VRPQAQSTLQFKSSPNENLALRLSASAHQMLSYRLALTPMLAIAAGLDPTQRFLPVVQKDGASTLGYISSNIDSAKNAREDKVALTQMLPWQRDTSYGGGDLADVISQDEQADKNATNKRAALSQFVPADHDAAGLAEVINGMDEANAKVAKQKVKPVVTQTIGEARVHVQVAGVKANSAKEKIETVDTQWKAAQEVDAEAAEALAQGSLMDHARGFVAVVNGIDDAGALRRKQQAAKAGPSVTQSVQAAPMHAQVSDAVGALKVKQRAKEAGPVPTPAVEAARMQVQVSATAASDVARENSPKYEARGLAEVISGIDAAEAVKKQDEEGEVISDSDEASALEDENQDESEEEADDLNTSKLASDTFLGLL